MHSNSNNIIWHHATVTRKHRQEQKRHRSAVVWFTGLSGSGKSTLAHCVEESLFKLGCHSFVLDGDNVRHQLCSDLGFSKADRIENIRRIGQVCKLFLEAGVIILTAFISPYRADRDMVRNLIPHGDFFEIFCQCPLETCEERDVKGYYAKAKQGLIEEFTGISSPYEHPIKPELTLQTDRLSLIESTHTVLEMLWHRDIIPKPDLVNL